MPFSLYLHFPYCRNKCSYCDFYKELYDPEAERKFYAALMTETRLASHQWELPDREIATIFVGGGTPSLTSRELFSTWYDLLKEEFDLSYMHEFSIENNPDSVDRDTLSFFRRIGINRPTFGIQSFKPQVLRLLNRKHNPEDSYRAIYLTKALGFSNFGCDLIFALPRQTSKMLSSDLDELIELEPPHISFYQLTVEPGTVLEARVKSGSLAAPDEDLSLAMYRGGCQRLAEAGYERYEVSSFAKPGHECRHNIAYWEGVNYLGLGPSAHSFINGRRFANVASDRDYIKSLAAGERPIVVDESGVEQRMMETIFLGLRMSRGIDRKKFFERFGVAVEERLDRSAYDTFVESGHIIPDRGKIKLSDEGFFVADEITRRLLL
jgi:oxygen-independent coproporphyrinogen-3 oxidase